MVSQEVRYVGAERLIQRLPSKQFLYFPVLPEPRRKRLLLFSGQLPNLQEVICKHDQRPITISARVGKHKEWVRE